MPGRTLRGRPTVRGPVCRVLSTRLPDRSCPRLSGSSEVGDELGAYHVYSPVVIPVVSEVVWPLSPYLNLTENCSPFHLARENLML